MLTTEVLHTWRLFVLAAVVFVLAPCASAGIIGVANATGPCSSDGLTNGGGTICSGNNTPYSLTALLNGTQLLRSDVGTQTAPVYLVNNDTGSTTFTLVFNGLLQSNQSVNCQENGGFAGKPCTVSGTLGTVGNSVKYGPPSANGQLVANFTFTGVPAGTFDLTFASFSNGDSGTLTGTYTGTLPSGSGPGCGAASVPVLVASDAERQLLTALQQTANPPSPKDLGTGTVVLSIVVDCSGKIISDTVVSTGSDAMTSAAMAAVNTWTYKPYLVNGNPVEVQTTVTISFSSGGKY
jgi:TonB family protein